MNRYSDDRPANPTTDAARGACRILIVDDHELFRDGLRELLEADPDVEICGEAESENDAFQAFLAAKPHLVTVDISLSSGNGLSLVTRIKKAKPDTAVIVLSMYDDRVYAERALRAGASGYVCKQSANVDIVNAIRAVRDGQIYLRDNILQRVLKGVSGRRPEPESASEQLSDRELEIFTLIGQGRTTQQIAQQLHLAVSTVETYRERLKTKLRLESGSELARHAILWVLQNS